MSKMRKASLRKGIDRRTFLAAAASTAALPMLPGDVFAAAKAGGQVNFAAWPPPTYLTSAVTTAGPEIMLGSKFFDGLLDYDFGMKPKPSLAESFEISPDGKRITFHLRKDIKWHDGKPFTSKDVAVTLMQITKVVHGRGRVTFRNLTGIETPDDHTAIFVMSKPSAAVIKSLDSIEVPIQPAHLYDGTDIMKNPNNVKPVGTGPWKLVSYKIGESVVMERNADYWRKNMPHIDTLTIQYVNDTATRTALLETGDVDVVPYSMVPLPDVDRLKKTGKFDITDKGYETLLSLQFMDFNLEHPILKKRDVRQALAHAIDPKWVAENVWMGYSYAATGPIHQDQTEFYTTDGVPSYPFNLKKAEELLDAAGHPRGANKIRFEITMAPLPWGDEPLKTAEYIREQFRQIGVQMNIVTSDMGAFVKRVYTDRQFDLNMIIGTSGADPVIGVHRFYLSTAFKPGVAFGNGSGFKNAEVDALLEAAEVELDAAKRRDQYKKFQQIIMTELPSLPIIACNRLTVSNKRVRDHTVGADGAIGSMAEAWLQS